jgi:hypothetical protein
MGEASGMQRYEKVKLCPKHKLCQPLNTQQDGGPLYSQRMLTMGMNRAVIFLLVSLVPMQVGDMFGDLAGLRATLAGMQASSPSGLIITRDSSEGKGSQQEGEGGDASASATAAAVAAAPAVDAEALARLAALGKEMQVCEVGEVA